MSSLLYENQPKKLEDVIKLSDELGFNRDEFVRDFESEEISKELSEELDNAANLNIDATPTMYINGDEVVGVKPYYELRKVLIEHGAKRK